jgi:hypothetical protein
MLWLTAAREGLDDEHSPAAAGARSWQHAGFVGRGGGLRVWDIDRAEILDRPMTETRQLFRVREPSYSEMVLHSGLFVPQIAPMKDLQPDDERITLQDHSICAGDKWYVYW